MNKEDGLFTIIDALSTRGSMAHIAARVRSCQHSAARLYAVYLLMRAGAQIGAIVRATGMPRGSASAMKARIQKLGLPLEPFAMRTDVIHTMSNKKARVIAAVESMGPRAVTARSIQSVAGLDYGTARLVTLGLARVGILAKCGRGTKRTGTIAAVYFAPHLATKAIAQYRCEECRSLMTIYYPTGLIAGAVRDGANRLACCICGRSQNPTDLPLRNFEVW